MHLRYTTITAADVFDTCIGGELLNDEALMARGRDKLRRWLAFTDRSGTFYEYNCPGYTGMSIERLAELAALSDDNQTRTIARVFAARMDLSALLHGHPGTGRWALEFYKFTVQEIFLEEFKTTYTSRREAPRRNGIHSSSSFGRVDIETPYRIPVRVPDPAGCGQNFQPCPVFRTRR